MELQQNFRQVERLGSLLGRSALMQQVYTQIKKATQLDITVLFQGESGTGKDLAAQTTHSLSARCEGPYIPVNLGALPAGVVSSELFGHEKGAFTGAVARRKGRFEQARNGSILLDEIESIDSNIQVTLLRLIEDQKFFRIGGKEEVSTNARLMAASNKDLQNLVNQGAFRQDLFYRLEVFPIQMPSLRDRPADLPLLIGYFVKCANHLMNKQITRIDPECLKLFEAYAWPGNVRELRNVIHRAVLLCDGKVIKPEHLPQHFHFGHHAAAPTINFPIGTPLDEIERMVLVRTLDFTNSNRTEAAKLLGISRRALYNRLHKHQLQ